MVALTLPDPLPATPPTPYSGYAPAPRVTIDGATITGTGPLTGQIALDGVTCRWGRSQVTDQPELATAQVTLFDGTRRWATATDRIGQRIDLAHVTTMPGASIPGDPVTFFRGRISDVQLSQRTVGGVPGVLVRLVCTSLLADLANITPTVAWPAETVAARASRISAAAAPIGVVARSSWGPAAVRAVAADQQKSLLDHVRDLYDSCGADRFSYSPSIGNVVPVSRRAYAERGAARLWWSQQPSPTVGAFPSARDGQGAYVAPMPLGGFVNTYLDGDRLAYDPAQGVQRGMASRITRVRVNYTDTAGATQYLELPIPGVDESVIGTRTAAVESLLTAAADVLTAALELRGVATGEAAAWRLQSVHISTGRLPLEEYPQVQLLLSGNEENYTVFLQRTWLPLLGIRPLFGVMGATVTYAGGGWALDLELSPVITTLPQHPITWEEIDNGSTAYRIECWDTPGHPRGFHPSVTCEDLRYVAAGLGVTTIPADNGSDEYQ